MAINAAAGLVEEWYTPESEADEDMPCQFLLAPLSQLEFLSVVAESVITPAGQIVPTQLGRVILLRKGVKGWDNFMDPDKPGEPLEFSIAAIDRIPAMVLAELAAEILNRSSLSEAEKKS